MHKQDQKIAISCWPTQIVTLAQVHDVTRHKRLGLEVLGVI